MTKEERKEYQKKYYETHKKEYSDYMKKYYEIHKEYFKKYCETHKKELNDYMKTRYKTHKEYFKKYYKTHKDEHNERSLKYYYNNKEYLNKKSKKYGKYSHYFRKNFSRFITLKNYITIIKLGDDSLKRSIMTKLGQGTIDQDEAIMLSGMVFTEEDEKEMNEWFKTCRCKSNLS